MYGSLFFGLSLCFSSKGGWGTNVSIIALVALFPRNRIRVAGFNAFIVAVVALSSSNNNPPITSFNGIFSSSVVRPILAISEDRPSYAYYHRYRLAFPLVYLYINIGSTEKINNLT